MLKNSKLDDGRELYFGQVISVKLDDYFRTKGLCCLFMGTEVETLEDIEYLCELEKELKKHERVLFVDFREKVRYNHQEAERGYLFENESSHTFFGPTKTLTASFAAEMVKELPIKVFHCVDTIQGMYKLGYFREDGMFVEVYESYSFGDVVEQFNAI